MEELQIAENTLPKIKMWNGQRVVTFKDIQVDIWIKYFERTVNRGGLFRSRRSGLRSPIAQEPPIWMEATESENESEQCNQSVFHCMSKSPRMAI